MISITKKIAVTEPKIIPIKANAFVNCLNFKSGVLDICTNPAIPEAIASMHNGLTNNPITPKKNDSAEKMLNFLTSEKLIGFILFFSQCLKSCF